MVGRLETFEIWEENLGSFDQDYFQLMVIWSCDWWKHEALELLSCYSLLIAHPWYDPFCCHTNPQMLKSPIYLDLDLLNSSWYKSTQSIMDLKSDIQ